MSANDRQEGKVLAAHAADRVSGAIALMTEDSPEGEPFAEGAKEALKPARRPASRTETVKPNDPPITLSGPGQRTAGGYRLRRRRCVGAKRSWKTCEKRATREFWLRRTRFGS